MPAHSSTSDRVGSFKVRLAGRSHSCRFPDVGNLRNIVANILAGRTYPLPVLEGYRPEVIVDVGANVGASALYFAKAWPEARLLCYEPSSRNLPFLQANLKDLPQARVFDHGLSDRNRETRLYHGKFQTAQDSTVPSVETGTDFEMIRLRRASEEFAARELDHISILKIDTEGAECAILGDLTDWLGRIDLIYVEYHSEGDRHVIDRLLEPWFKLYCAKAVSVHRGENGYISNDLLARYPAHEALEIARSIAD